MRWWAVAFVFLVALLVPARAEAGYTHYWRWYVTPDKARLEETVREMNRIAESQRDIVADDKKRTGAKAEFLFEEDAFDAGLLPAIALNGIGAAQHETFVFPLAWQDPNFVFVKTAMKPYDVVVTACLIVARDHFTPEELAIQSDGEWNSEWHAGARLYEKVLGRPAKNPIAGVVVEGERSGGSESSSPFGAPSSSEVPESKRRTMLAIMAALAFVVVVVMSVRTRPG